jgi:hypothetical protein
MNQHDFAAGQLTASTVPHQSSHTNSVNHNHPYRCELVPRVSSKCMMHYQTLGQAGDLCYGSTTTQTAGSFATHRFATNLEHQPLPSLNEQLYNSTSYQTRSRGFKKKKIMGRDLQNLNFDPFVDFLYNETTISNKNDALIYVLI